jgi:ketosteroid isomerase-like protein
MQRLRAAAVVVVSLGALAAGCATVSNGEREKEALLRVDREWAAAAAEGKDVERIVSFWSDDATVFPAGGPVLHGKAAIRAYVQESLALPGFQISWSSDQASVSADGTLGYTTGTNSLTVPGPDGTLFTGAGRGVAVWRRLPGGEWKCVVDTWNFGP